MNNTSLQDLMEFDCPIQVDADGNVHEAPNRYAPECYWNGWGQGQHIEPNTGWSLLNGYSHQEGYAGPIMHASEFVGGYLVTYPDYYRFLQDAIDAGDSEALANVVLTVGVVSNHGNWFTATDHNKEMKVLAQSYDWLIFLTDTGLAEFIETVLQGSDARFARTRAAFAFSHSGQRGTPTFTKVTVDVDADRELTRYFAETNPWARWFNVITPGQPIQDLRTDFHKLSQLKGGGR